MDRQRSRTTGRAGDSGPTGRSWHGPQLRLVQRRATCFRAHAERLRAELAHASLEEKVAAVVELLSGQGFMAAWTVEANHLQLAEHNCAVRAAAEQFPEICAAEADFLREVLQSDLERNSYIPDGCNACQYTIAMGAPPRDDPSSQEDSR